MRTPKWVSALELDRWAATPAAKLLLPELVRRLIRATVPPEDLKKLDFPSGAEVHRPGFDGTTVVTKATLYVPEGVAGWELGCDGNVKGKAESDYNNRIRQHDEKIKAGGDDDISQTTFIAVSALDWHRPEDWVADKVKERKFKDVRAYDSNRLEQWIWEAPAVGLWLAQEIFGHRDGVSDVKSQWEGLQATLIRPIPPDVLLANRASMKSTFAEWLREPNGQLVVRAPSIGELVEVFCAWVHSLSPEEAELIASRAIIVENKETWKSLATSINPLILIAAPGLDGDSTLYATTAAKHHVLRYAPFTAPRGNNVIEMPRMRRFDVQQALKAAGVPDVDAAKLADASGGNFTILRRRLARNPDDARPDWASDLLLAPLLLAGSWQDANPNDQQFVSGISGKAYGEIQSTMTKWRQAPDAPLRHVDGTWEFLSPMDAWEFVHVSLTSTQLNAFQAGAVEVLGEDDPGLELKPEDRAMAAFKGKKRKFSHSLRQGISEVLALGAAREQESSIGLELHFGDRADAIVRKLLPPNCDWKRWASLGDVLPQLIEAAPSAVIEAYERDLRSEKPSLVQLMQEEIPPSALFGAAYHTGALWALQRAAWSPKFLPQVASLLAKLAELDPGGKWANRPDGSLQSLFFSWRPQTMASLRERIETLKTVVQTAPNVGSKLLLSLLPRLHESIMDNSMPSYRDWAAGWTGTVTVKDYDAFNSELVSLILADVGTNPDRWLALLEDVHGLAPRFGKQIGLIRDRIGELVSAGMQSDLRFRLWEKLRHLVRDHTYFHDAHWALPSDEVSKFAELRDRLAPTDTVLSVKHYFNEALIYEGDPKLTYEENEANQNATRRSAVRQLWTSGGFDSLLRLASEVKDAWPVGLAVGEELKGEVEDQMVPALLTSATDSFRRLATAYARRRIIDEGSAWAEGIPNDKWTYDQKMTFALEMPFERRTWDWVAKLGDSAEREYWKQTGAFAGWRLPEPDALYAVKSLQDAGRAWGAADLIGMLLHNKTQVSNDVLFDALDAILAGKIERKGGTMDVHHVTEIFKVLQGRSDADVTRLAHLEFGFLSILDRFTLLPKTLQRELSRSPEFFVECLSVLYRRHSEPPSETKPPDPDGSKAEKAKRIWQLLHDWRVIPGTDSNGDVVFESLREWVTNARKRAKDADRLEVCDIHIGQVFARSGEDPSDQSIPVVPVREVIELFNSEEMQRGYAVGLHNLRGTFSKGMYEGGDQERKLAENFNAYADRCAKWPHTAAVLRSVADSYLRQAVREDEQASARD